MRPVNTTKILLSAALIGIIGCDVNSPDIAQAPNITPFLQADSYSISTGSSNNMLDVQSNDSCNCTMQITTVTDPDGDGPSTVEIIGNQIRYTPDPALGDTAAEQFEYTVSNGAGTDVTTTVDIVLASGPAANTDALTISKNSPQNPITPLSNDSVPSGTTAELLTFDSVTANGGKVWLADDGETLVFQPALNSTTADSFNYTMSDGTTQASGVVNITINEHIPQARPCETEAVARQAAGRPYCFDVLIPADTADGHVIAATVFVPADQGASKPPVLLHAHGFGESRFAELENPSFVMVNRVTAQSLLELWHEGYWVVTYDQRGFNASVMWGPTADSSNGTCVDAADSECIDVLNPEREARDQVTVVDWIQRNLRDGYQATLTPAGSPDFTAPAETADPLYDDSDGNIVIGSIGLSYGGGFQTMGSAVAQAIHGASRVDAMVPVTTWWDIRYSLAPNDVPKSGWVEFLTAATALGGTTPAPNGFLANVGLEAVVLDNTSDASFEGLYQRSPRSYCDGLGDNNIGDQQEPTQGTGTIASVPNVFIIQGQRDMLFNYNEALKLAQCYEAGGSSDVRVLVQTEGHILSTAQSPSYKGVGEIIYVDEEVYCDQAGNDLIITRELISSWFREKLGAPAVPEAFSGTNQLPPKMCTTHFLNSAAPANGHTFGSFADVPIGDSSLGGTNTFAIASEGAPVTFTLPGGLPGQPFYSQSLITATTETVISGIPKLSLTVTGTGSPLLDDARFFAALAVQRSGSATATVLADQYTPISGPAPEIGLGCLAGGCPVDFTFPRADGHYPEQVGESDGEIAGFSVKLEADDQLILQFYDQAPVYNLHNTLPGLYNLSAHGEIEVPVVPLAAVP